MFVYGPCSEDSPLDPHDRFNPFSVRIVPSMPDFILFPQSIPYLCNNEHHPMRLGPKKKILIYFKLLPKMRGEDSTPSSLTDRWMDQVLVYPPSILRSAPVVYAAASESRYTTAPIRSSGDPILPWGISDVQCRWSSGLSARIFLVLDKTHLLAF